MKDIPNKVCDVLSIMVDVNLPEENGMDGISMTECGAPKDNAQGGAHQQYGEERTS